MGMTIADELREQGMMQAKRDYVVRVLLARFPQAPRSLEERIRALSDPGQLDDLPVRVATASKLDEVVFH